MPDRYQSRDTIVVDKADMFKQLKARRNLNSVTLFSTLALRPFRSEELEGIQFETRIWTTGDRFYKIANEYYGDPAYWWAIALANGKPTEQHLKLGDEIIIPIEIESFLNIIGAY
tara:strand:+ start:1837 stop:2181 length:345 start_codon:yes stop_codon:yes gene_type:complete